MRILNLIKEYYQLAKPGIIYGNLLTTVAAFFFAARWLFLSSLYLTEVAFVVFVATCLGLGFVIGSGCVFNNYLDREMDRRMERTKNRALVTGRISGRAALIYGTILGIVGFALLWFLVNALTALVALGGWFSYVVVYGYAKRTTPWAAVVGSIPGAVPIVVGYTAVTGQLDLAALLLFFVLVCWQMPHFYGIATYRLDEYVAANIPVLPAQKGIRTTKMHMVAFIAAFMIATLVIMYFRYAGYIYGVGMFAISAMWLVRAWKGFKITDPELEKKWARGIFLFSLIVLLTFSLLLAVGPVLP